MNMFYSPTMSALRQLVDGAQPTLALHNVVVDYDGEVIIDPELKYPGIDIKRFKIRKRIQVAGKLSERALKRLYNNMVSAYNGAIAK